MSRPLSLRQKSALAQIARRAWREGGHLARAQKASAAADPFGLPDAQTRLFDHWRRAEALRAIGLQISQANETHYRTLANHFTALGNAASPLDRPLYVSGEARTFSSDRRALGTKIQALLCDAQLTWPYADGIAHQMFGLERVEWCRAPELRSVITALIKHTQAH